MLNQENESKKSQNLEEFDNLEHNSACLACGDKLTSFGCLVCLSCLNDQCEQFLDNLEDDGEIDEARP